MESCRHFLSVETETDGKKYRHELYYLTEQNKIGHTVTLLEDNMETEEYVPTVFISMSEFSASVDKYMGHPGKTYADEEFVDELLYNYMFDEIILE